MAMQLIQSPVIRQEMKTLLTPRMIQSMEILQLPLVALEERIEQEMQENPLLEMKIVDPDELMDGPAEMEETAQMDGDGEQTLIVDENSDQAADFERLAKLGEYLENEEFYTNSSQYRSPVSDGQRDRKMDAMNNTMARPITLAEHLLGQWAFVECTPSVRAAGVAIIGYLEDDGYLRTPLEEIHEKAKGSPEMADLEAALERIQKLEPAGVGARSVQECLLLQLNALEHEADPQEAAEHDFDLERTLISKHLKDLEMNRYPKIAKKLGCDIERIKAAVKRLGRLHPHPGRQVGGEDAMPITPDATVSYDPDTDEYDVTMANDPSENLSISQFYRRMLKNRQCDRQTRHFLNNNLRNAKWLIESIEQRRGTVERVIRAVVAAQREFLDKGPEFLKPLPMIQVADQLGIHVATVSRAVSEKWIQTPRGVFPLRKFFSGGTTNAEGEDMSWNAVKEKLKTIIDREDKSNPLNDDEIVEQLKEQGITLARRTVAKYRKLLNIPTARQRKEF